MAPRLKGPALSLALASARTSLGRATLRKVAFGEYGMDRLLSLGPEELAPLLNEPRPIAGGQARMWEDARLDLPTPPQGISSGRALKERFATGDLHPLDLVDATEARLAASDFGAVSFSPFVANNFERAREAAHAAGERWAAGNARGPLDGLPVPVKDEVHVRGLPTRAGTAYVDATAEQDGFAVRQLEQAGAVITGKTHTTEWGMSSVGINPNFSMPRNAHQADRAGGGSSTGTAAAIALGLATVALGSDGGGSIRIPSSFQGILGLKPTFQRIGRSGDIFGQGTVSVLGPLGATTADLVDFMLATAHSRDEEDYACAYAPPGTPPLAAWDRALGRGVKGARIGIPRGEWEDADPRIAALCMDALHTLEKDGARLVEIDLPHAQVAQAIGVLSIGPETIVHVRDFAPEHLSRFGAELQLQFAILGSVGAQEYLLAQRARAALRASTAKAIQSVDVVAWPTVPKVAPIYPRSEDLRQVSDDTATREACRYSFLANLTGYPSSSTPVGLVDGLPVGLQILGDAWDEASIIAIMAHLERTGAGGMIRSAAYRSLGA